MPERKIDHEMHSWVQERLSAYMDNQLPALERLRVERHLIDCMQCQGVLSSLRWTVSLLKQAPAPVLPRSFVVPVHKQTPRAPVISISLLRLAAAMATLLLISLVGIDVITQLGSTGAPAMLSAPQVAIAPTSVAAQAQAPSSDHATSDANTQTFKEGARGAPPGPLPKATTALTEAPPMVAPFAAALPTDVPPTAAPKPAAPSAATLAPTIQAALAATSAPAATVAPGAGAISRQTDAASRPAARSSVAQGSTTPSAPQAMGKGGGPEKSSQDNAAATAAPLLTQPQPPVAENQATPTAPPPEILPPTPTIVAPPRTATPSSRPEALAQSTVAPIVQPTPEPYGGSAMPVSPLRIAELGALFVAVFLGVLALLLRR